MDNKDLQRGMWRSVMAPMLTRLKYEFGVETKMVRMHTEDLREHRMEDIEKFAGSELAGVDGGWREFMIELTAVKMLLSELEEDSLRRLDLGSLKSIPELRGLSKDERSTSDKPYSPESYVAQYGITIEDAQRLVEEQYDHGGVVWEIQRLFSANPDYRKRAIECAPYPLEPRKSGVAS